MTNKSHFAIFDSGIRLGLITIAAIGLVVLTDHLTKDAIADQEHKAALKALTEVLPERFFDNDPLAERYAVQAEKLGPGDHWVYPALLNAQASAFALEATAADGYNGEIKLLLGIDIAGSITGVRVSSHKETPGLGDGIDLEVSNWILVFNGKSLSKPTENDWELKKQGGEFDQLTGASITPRAVVHAVRKALEWAQDHLLNQDSTSSSDQ